MHSVEAFGTCVTG